VFDERVALTRSDDRDYFERNFAVSGPSTIVVIVEEDDADVGLRLSAGVPAQPIEVESRLYGRGLEVAALTLSGSSQVTVSLSSPQEMRVPGFARVRILRYDSENTDAAGQARLDTFRNWTTATLANSNINETRRSSIDLMGKVAAHFDSPAGDPRLAAWAHMVTAQLHYSPDVSWKDALVEARRAEQAFRSLAVPELRNAARARYKAGEALLQLLVIPGATPSAEDAAQEARRIFEELSAPTSAMSAIERAWATVNLFLLEYQLEDWNQGRKAAMRALAEMRAVGHLRGELVALGNLGTIAAEAGNYQEAVRYHDQVMARLDSVPSVYSRLALVFNAANADAYTGRSERALQRYLLGLRYAREVGSRAHEGRMLHGLGHVYLNRGDLAQAATFYGAALDIRRTVNDEGGLLASLRMAGRLARETGDTGKAIEMHSEAAARAGTPHVLLRAQLELALDYLAMGDGVRAMNMCREALGADGGPDSARADEIRLTLAALLMEKGSTGNLAEADALIARAEAGAANRSDLLLEVFARRTRAQFLVRRARFKDAREEYERAIRLIYEYRSLSPNPELQATTLVHEQATFRGYVDLLMRETAARDAGRLARVTPAEEQALRTLEFARALNFRPPRDPRMDAATQARIDGLLARMAEKRVRIAANSDRSSPSARAQELLQLDMARLRAELDRVRAEVVAPGEAVGVRPAGELPAAEFAWGALGPGEAQVSYALGQKHAYLWVRDTHGISATVLAETPAQVERRLDVLLAANRMQAPETLEAGLARLSQLLMPRGMLHDAAVVEIIADGKLANIPFAALRSPTDPARRLIETHVVRNVASMLKVPANGVAREPDWSFIAVSASGGGARRADKALPTLSATGSEAAAIAALFSTRDGAARVKLLSADGTAQKIAGLWSGGAGIVHFATHGLANVRHPMASLLLLPATDADGQATYLTAGQVQEWRGEVGLVFLAACDTAVGPARFADGMPGLQRAFLRAGARGVIATLWPIEDVAARDFSLDFYRRLLELQPDVALRETQRAWLVTLPGMKPADALRRRMTAWAHVYYTQ
jgi:tetratricopeptide (TPR) repeat protein